MKKILYIFLIVILAAGLFVAYKFGFNFNQNKLEARTYEEIKQSAEKNLENLSIEDLYLLANREDDEKYYTALYNAYKKENPDVALQYLYNEFVVKNNRKVYPLLKEEAKSDVKFTATETGYKKALNKFFKNEENEGFEFVNFDFLFVPKFYDSRSKDECIYSFSFKEGEDIKSWSKYTCDAELPSLDMDYIDSIGINNNPVSYGFRKGCEDIFFKNFDGKTILAFSFLKTYENEEKADIIIEQNYLYKDYMLRVDVFEEGNLNVNYNPLPIGRINNIERMYFSKGDKEISKEEFEKNVVPVYKLVNLSKQESKTWTKISAKSMMLEYSNDIYEEEQNKVNNLILYTYDISLDKDVDIPYLKAYLKHLYTIKNSGLLFNEDNDGQTKEKNFYVNIHDFDKDGYPEILINYVVFRNPYWESHSKIVAYDPEKKSTYLLCDFIDYKSEGNGGEDSNNGGLFKKDGKDYFALLSQSGGATGVDSYIALYEKNGNNLDFVDSSVKAMDSDISYSYPTKKTVTKDMFFPEKWILPDQNSKEKYLEFFNNIISKKARDEAYDIDGMLTGFADMKNVIDPFYLTDIEEIKDILLSNKMLEVPKYKRVVVGDKFYPYSSLLKEEGAEYIDINVLKDLNSFNIDEDKIIKKMKINLFP